MNRFEQLIEYVINDEEAKARELFHEIVVEKSRQIYENLMVEEAEEELDEAKKEEEEEELDEAAEEELDEAAEEEELDEAAEEEVEEGAMGGDAADDLIDEVEMEEQSDINMEGDEELEVDADVSDEGGSEPATKDDIMDLETKLDELMAEFEQLMGSDDMGDGDDMGADEGGDAIEMDDTEEMEPMAEAISLKAAPKPTTSEEGGVNKKSVVAANSGAAGMASKPVKTDTAEEKGRKAPDAKDMISDFQNKAGAGMKDQKAAPKPVTSQASGVNTKSPLPGGRKG